MSTTDSPAALFAKDGPIAVVTLNRPRWRNAYNMAMRDALYEIFDAIHADPEVRCVILRGKGTAFCSGGDLREFGAAESPVAARRARWQRDIWGRLRSLSAVTLASVHGAVVGGGFEMALLCDLRIAAANARFSLPETGLGMIPGVAGTQTTTRLLGVSRALDLVLMGSALDAAQAQALGIVNRVVPASRLASATRSLARRIAALPAGLVRELKLQLRDGLDLPVASAIDVSRKRMTLAAMARRKDTA